MANPHSVEDLHKIFLDRPSRYSEDIDLVQVDAGPIGPLFDGLREALTPWLGEPSRKLGPGVANLTHRVPAESDPHRTLRLKIEINTREHFARLGFISKLFGMESRWHRAECRVKTYVPAEILGTKMRALYQRRKGRDLFDLWLGLTTGLAEPDDIVMVFRYYMEQEGAPIAVSDFTANLEAKMTHPGFLNDITPLIPVELHYDARIAARLVQNALIAKL